MDTATKQAEYDELLALTLRMGAYLTGPRADLIPRAEWEVQFARYTEILQRLRVLGDELRPTRLRPVRPPLNGDKLVSDVLALFED